MMRLVMTNAIPVDLDLVYHGTLQNVEIPKYKHVILSGTSRNSYAFIVYQQKSDQMNRIIESSNHRIKIQPASSVHVTALGQITS